MTQIKLRVDHIHSDKEYPAGATLEVDAMTAKWLTDHGHADVIAAPSPAQKPQPKPAMSEEDN